MMGSVLKDIGLWGIGGRRRMDGVEEMGVRGDGEGVGGEVCKKEAVREDGRGASEGFLLCAMSFYLLFGIKWLFPGARRVSNTTNI